MKTEGGKVAASRTMLSSNFVSGKSHAGGEDLSVKAMWDEEFFGHELPPNYKIARIQTPIGPEKRPDSDGRREIKVEQAIWDEEFLGHRLPANYVICRLRTPEDKRKDSKRDAQEYIPGEQSDRFQRQIRFAPEDTFEYSIDKTVDSYVLSEEPSGIFKDVESPEDRSMTTKEDGKMGETFEERALRFGVEDWNLIDKKWSQHESKGGKRSARRGIFHSPSGSDTSSQMSTLESSSFSFGSEGSSFAKTDYSSSSFNLCHVYGTAGGTIPGRQVFDVSGEGRAAEEAQFLELSLCKGEKSEFQGFQGQSNELKGSSYLEFNFLDGKMIASEDSNAVDGGVRDGARVPSSRTIDEDASSQDFAGTTPTMYQSASAQSPESENFFDSSHDSDWSGTRSVSTFDQGLISARDAVILDFDDDERSYCTEDRTGEDWNSDSRFYDAEGSAAPSNPASSSGSKGHSHLNRGGCGKVAIPVKHPELDLVPSSARSSGERTAKSPNKLQRVSRKTRSLGSVLGHHLGLTAVPSLRYRAQSAFSEEQKDSPAKVTAACIEWRWPEKGAMKPLQALRALAERENAERDRIGGRTSPPVRSLESAFKESRTSVLGKPQQVGERSHPGSEIDKESETLVNSQRDTAKESRESILASWAAVSGVGEAAGGRRRRLPTATRATPVASSFKQGGSRGSASPRNRSVSFGAHAGSKAGTALPKSVPKNLALELEVMCRPFGPVLKGVRFLPTSKRSLGRPPLFSNLGHQLSSSSASSITLPPVLKCGRLQSVLTRDGLPSYTLIMEESEEIFIAKTLRVDGGFQEGVSHRYTFHSYKGKGKGKHGWRQWGKKEKPSSDFAGNMTVTSTICPVAGSESLQNFVESEFVLFDSKVKELSISGPTSTSPYPRSSFSSWDTVTPQRSPQGASSTYSSPSSTCFSLPSPASAGVLCPTSSGSGSTPLPIPSRKTPLTTPTGVNVRPTSLDKGVSRFKHLERYLSLGSPLHTQPKMAALNDSMSDSEVIDDYDSRIWASPQCQSELAALIVRTPLDKGQGKATSAGDKWGWGINFLRKSFDSTRTGCSPGQEEVAAGNSPNAKVGQDEKVPSTSTAVGEDCSIMEQRCSACGSSSLEEQSSRALSINLLLPTGEHGCSANGIDGPQSLIERWRSGGKCDCGSWDLGCGLTIISNQRSEDGEPSLGSAQHRDGALRLYLQGRKQQTVGLGLTPVREGCYTLGFQAPLSPLHAFATAVAILHSRDLMIPSKRVGETKRRLTRIPVKVSSPRSSSRQVDEFSGLKSHSSYNRLVCPDPPSSPFGRA